MSESNSCPRPDLLDLAIGELRDAPTPDGPRGKLTSATILALKNRLAGAVPGDLAHQRRRRRIMRYVGYGSAAAVAVGVLVATGLFVTGGRTAEAAFLRAMDKAAKAETVRFTWSQTSGPPGQKGQQFFRTDKDGNVRVYDSSSESVMKVIAKGTKVRVEYGETVTRLEDYSADTVLTLDHKYKFARRFVAGGQEGDWYGLFARLAKLRPEEVKPAGEEMIGRVKALKFELEKGEKTGVIVGEVWPGAKWTIWIDPKTDWPVRLTYVKDENLKWEFTDFVWNEPAEDALFEQKAPAGYKLIEEQKQPEPSEPEDGRTVYIKFVQPAMERARQTESVVYTRTDNYPKKKEKKSAPDVVVVTTYIQAGAAREEYSNGVTILADDTLLTMIHSKKTYRKVPSRVKLKSAAEVLAQFLGVKNENAKELGNEKLGEVIARKYEVKVGGLGAGTTTLWVDPKTGFPVKVHFAAADGKHLVTLEKFRWNDKLDPKLFSLNPPAGYKLSQE